MSEQIYLYVRESEERACEAQGWLSYVAARERFPGLDAKHKVLSEWMRTGRIGTFGLQVRSHYAARLASGDEATPIYRVTALWAGRDGPSEKPGAWGIIVWREADLEALAVALAQMNLAMDEAGIRGGVYISGRPRPKNKIHQPVAVSRVAAIDPDTEVLFPRPPVCSSCGATAALLVISPEKRLCGRCFPRPA